MKKEIEQQDGGEKGWKAREEDAYKTNAEIHVFCFLFFARCCIVSWKYINIF